MQLTFAAPWRQWRTKPAGAASRGATATWVASGSPGGRQYRTCVQCVAVTHASNRNQVCRFGRSAFRRRTGRRRDLFLSQPQEITYGVSRDKDSATDMHGPEIAPPHQFICQASRHADGPSCLFYGVRKTLGQQLSPFSELVRWLAISRQVSNERTLSVDGRRWPRDKRRS
jgi:hypothetical protein